MKGASLFPFVGLMLAAWGVYEVVNHLLAANSSNAASDKLLNGQQAAFFAIAPGAVEVGTKNSTGGFTAAPDPSGIGGGFST